MVCAHRLWVSVPLFEWYERRKQFMVSVKGSRKNYAAFCFLFLVSVGGSEAEGDPKDFFDSGSFS